MSSRTGALLAPIHRLAYCAAPVNRPLSAPVRPDPLSIPLCVDLDGTLIRSDLLWEGLIRLWRQSPLYLATTLKWWFQGRARLKAEVARRILIPISTLPWNEEFLDHVRRECAKGRSLYLVTASDQHAARAVAVHLGLFRDVLASDGCTNLRSHTKARTLATRFGMQGFDYAGNSSADLPVWQMARAILVVHAPRRLIRKVLRWGKPVSIFDCPPRPFTAFLESVRPCAWMRNLWVFLPLLFHPVSVSDPSVWQNTLIAFLAFTLCASGAYLWDDLMDVDADRAQPIKTRPPVATGKLPIAWATTAAPLCIISGMALASAVSPKTILCLVAYAGLAISGNWCPTRPATFRLVSHLLCLALRVLAGRAAAGLPWVTPGIGLELLPLLLWTLFSHLRSEPDSASSHALPPAADSHKPKR
ncbi:MAG: UbiA family prenyltransferase [Verrucomicrobiota bacterium]|nr:UbiA family prenyltransferase [Limisphaera sp.]MDW8382311.1 UbiA family prenyltransferase [Verrucomicrobiota bacterium]